MAIKAADQVSIIDITDAYSVMLTSDSHTFTGSVNAALAGSTSTQVVALCGSEAVPVTIGSITTPTGVTATIADNGTTAPIITIAVTSSVTSGGTVKIPVTITGKDVTITKEFTYAIAFKGAQGIQGEQGEQGEQGDKGDKGDKGDTGDTGAAGADAITISITTDNGNIFKNSEGKTTLTAHVYQAGAELDATAIAALGTLKWYKDGDDEEVGAGASIEVWASSISSKAVYTVQLEG